MMWNSLLQKILVTFNCGLMFINLLKIQNKLNITHVACVTM